MLNQLLKLLKNKKEVITDINEQDTPVSGEKDYSLHSGERQTSSSVEGIRADHTSRYELLYEYFDRINEQDNVQALDVFCGNGYGVYMLTHKYHNLHMIGVDGSKEAIEQANINYSLGNNLFSNKLFPFVLPKNNFDIVSCFESLEHVEDDVGLFKQIVSSVKQNGTIIVSVPNQKLHDLIKNPHKFHFRHYEHQLFLDTFGHGLALEKWYGQNVYHFDENGNNTFKLLKDEEMIPIEFIEGQVNIYVFRKI